MTTIYMNNPVTQRYYWLMLQQDLFGVWCVRKLYGGLTNNHKREVWQCYDSQAEASKALAQIEYTKRQRGYVYADIEMVEYFTLKPQTIREL